LLSPGAALAVSDSRRYLNPPPADAAYLPAHSPDDPSKAHALLLYANAFLGEFFHHAVIQTTLERALRQGRAVLHGACPSTRPTRPPTYPGCWRPAT
jgi:hypothetical protein